MRLVYEADPGREVKVGDEVKDFRGETWIVDSFSKPRSPASTGRVYCSQSGKEWQSDFYPSVIGAVWIEREDRDA